MVFAKGITEADMPLLAVVCAYIILVHISQQGWFCGKPLLAEVLEQRLEYVVGLLFQSCGGQAHNGNW